MTKTAGAVKALSRIAAPLRAAPISVRAARDTAAPPDDYGHAWRYGYFACRQGRRDGPPATWPAWAIAGFLDGIDAAAEELAAFDATEAPTPRAEGASRGFPT